MPKDDTFPKVTLSEALISMFPPSPPKENESISPPVALMLPVSLSTFIRPPCCIPSERIPRKLISPGLLRVISPAIPSVEKLLRFPIISMLF